MRFMAVELADAGRWRAANTETMSLIASAPAAARRNSGVSLSGHITVPGGGRSNKSWKYFGKTIASRSAAQRHATPSIAVLRAAHRANSAESAHHSLLAKFSIRSALNIFFCYYG
jgi:hypothetical protein